MSERELVIEYLKSHNLKYMENTHMYTHAMDMFYLIAFPEPEIINSLLDFSNVYVVTDVQTYYLFKNSDYIEYERFTKGVCIGEYYQIKIITDMRQYEVTDIIACYMRFYEPFN